MYRFALCAFISLLSLGWSTVLIAEDPPAAQAAKDRAVVETLLRLKGMNVNASPVWKSAAMRHLETVKGTPKYVDLVEKLRLRGVEDELFRLALEDPRSTTGAKATQLLVKSGELARFAKVAKGDDEQRAVNAVTALGEVGDAAAVELLKNLIVDPACTAALRVAAVIAVGKNRTGQRYLLDLAATDRLPPELKFSAANALLGSAEASVRTEAGKYLSLPAAANSQPLPPVADLLKMKGDFDRGRQIFQTTGTCSKCHPVRGQGKQVGPDLSEIGSKLTRDAFFVSILDPSAGISHNYESYVVVTTGGSVLTGLLINRTDQSVTLRTAEAIDKEIPMAEVEEIEKSRTSLMPADLQKVLTVQDLVDVVEFLAALKKSS